MLILIFGFVVVDGVCVCWCDVAVHVYWVRSRETGRERECVCVVVDWLIACRFVFYIISIHFSLCSLKIKKGTTAVKWVSVYYLECDWVKVSICKWSVCFGILYDILLSHQYPPTLSLLWNLMHLLFFSFFLNCFFESDPLRMIYIVSWHIENESISDLSVSPTFSRVANEGGWCRMVEWCRVRDSPFLLLLCGSFLFLFWLFHSQSSSLCLLQYDLTQYF